MYKLEVGDELRLRAYDGGRIGGEFRQCKKSWKYYFYFGPSRYCNEWISRKIQVPPEMFGMLVPDYSSVFKDDLWLFDDIDGARKLYGIIKYGVEEGKNLYNSKMKDDYERKQLGLCMK